MGLEVLVLHQGHRDKFHRPRHKCHHPLTHLLLHLWECPLGSLLHQLGMLNLHHRCHLQMDLHVQ